MNLADIEKKVSAPQTKSFTSLDQIEANVAGQVPAAKPIPNSLDAIEQAVSPVQQPQEIEIPGFAGQKAHPMLVRVAQEYYGKTDPNEALSSWVADQTWNSANSAMALIDAVKAQTVDPIKAKQMSFLGEQFDNLPAFWEGENRPLGERASRLWANIWRGVVDPITWAGGAVGGKVASKFIGEGAGILARSAGAAVSDAAAGAVSDVSQQVLQKSIGTRDEYSPLETAEAAGAMGLFGGVIRGGAGAIKKGFSILKRPDALEPNTNVFKQDNAPYQYQLDKATPVEDQSNAMSVLTRREAIPEPANANKFPEMETTRPIETITEPTPLQRTEQELGYGETNFSGLSPMEGQSSIPEPIKENQPLIKPSEYKPFDYNMDADATPNAEPVPVVKENPAKVSKRIKKEPFVADDPYKVDFINPVEETPKDEGIPFMVTRQMKQDLADRGYTLNQIRNMTPKEAHEILKGQNKPEPPKTPFKEQNPIIAQALDNADEPKPIPKEIKLLDNGDIDLSAPPTVPPKPPGIDEIPPIKPEGPTPLHVERLEKLTGKVDKMTYMNSPAEMWSEIIRLSEANEGFNTERPHISKEASLASAKELLGDPSLNIFKTLENKLGVSGDRLSTVVSGALYQYNKEGVQLHTLASDFNEKLWKLGKDNPETLKSLVAYAQFRLKFTDVMKSFYGSKSEIGRSLAMLKPNYNESPEEYLMRIIKDMNGPEGLQGDGATLLCG